MKLHIQCQYMENYGAHNWDGEGECPQSLKSKGGEEYFYPLGADNPTELQLVSLVTLLRDQIEWSDIASRQYIVGYGVQPDNFMTEYEKSQLEYDGHIAYPAKFLKLKEMA